MKLYRCRICHEPSPHPEGPSRCAFCGAPDRLLVPAAEFQPTAVGQLSDPSRRNLERALAAEVENAGFYRSAARLADTDEGTALFEVLARIETTRAALLCRLLDREEPEELREPGACSPSHKENLAEACKRRDRALRLYRKAFKEAEEARVRQVLGAFAEWEEEPMQTP